MYLRDSPESAHIAVLADMKELGENYLAYHREVGEYAANSGVDLVVTLGEASKCLAEGVRAVKEIPVVEFLDRDEMVKYLEQEVKTETVSSLKDPTPWDFPLSRTNLRNWQRSNIKTAIKLLKERRDPDWNSTRTLSLIFL